MIPRSFIQEWAKHAPWQQPRQVEQDLIITKALLQIFSIPELRESLAFRGGTALNKLFFNPPSRYSEDIDLVQIKATPIGSTIDSIRSVMDSWMGAPARTFSEGLVTLTYKTTSDDGFPLKLKVEINSREHFTVLGLHDYEFASNSSWAEGKVNIMTFKIEELLATKLRALYQRRKGRDLFDLHLAITKIKNLDYEAIISCFREYMKFGGHHVTKKLFIDNMETKLQNKQFCGDMIPLLPYGTESFISSEAYIVVKEHLLDRL